MELLVMDHTIFKIFFYCFAAFLIACVIILYLRRKAKQSKITDEKIEKALENGLHEPVSLYPHVDLNSCIGTGHVLKHVLKRTYWD
jgi:hypothetical protein